MILGVGVIEFVGVIDDVGVILGVIEIVGVIDGVGVILDVGVTDGLGNISPKTVNFLDIVSSLQPGCLLTTNIVYSVPVVNPVKSKTTPAAI